MLPKEECEVLMRVLFPFAEDQLKKHREFYPFGAVMLNDGTVELTSDYDGEEFPDSNEVIDRLIQIHKDMAHNNKIKASGIAWNASVASSDGKKSDSIVISLEHKDDYSVVVGKPYKLGLFKKFTPGALFAMEGNNNIF